ncbi:hypothetical protein [Sandaracinus amylolyticus]|uniref:Uncharacterized protein n=1 Tax=Sandaracinus amylolyticus TaxID=927083 RepID=A0A0F6WA73_9BACT|nr:hypothetical protein [Sandaracinus amylolyticus]AKF11381.1 hypothetical protein DB32_008530 [Sandaracinus amylolyticus]
MSGPSDRRKKRQERTTEPEIPAQGSAPAPAERKRESGMRRARRKRDPVAEELVETSARRDPRREEG